MSESEERRESIRGAEGDMVSRDATGGTGVGPQEGGSGGLAPGMEDNYEDPVGGVFEDDEVAEEGGGNL